MSDFLEHLEAARWNALWDGLASLTLRMMAAIAILWAGWWMARRVSRWLAAIFARQQRLDATLRPIVCDSGLWGVRIVAVMGALSQLGIETASIVAVLGAAGLAIGLALQGTLQNIAAGIMLLLLRPFRVGDYIDGGGGTVAGTVEEVSLFTTRLTKPDGICEYVPNGQLWASSIRNYTRNPIRRLDLEVDISMRDDVHRAVATLQALATADPRVLAEPPPQVLVMRFDDSVAVLNIRVWCATAVFWDVRWDLALRVRQTLRDAGFLLPLRAREMYLAQQSQETDGARAKGDRECAVPLAASHPDVSRRTFSEVDSNRQQASHM
jgi:small conductance mechanosensitive channel